MPERRNLKKFGHRANVESLLIGVLGIVAFGFMFIEWPVRGLKFWIATTVFVSVIIGLYLLERFRYRFTQCPECSALLKRPSLVESEPGDPVCLVCENCDIEWDTGLRVPDVR